MPVRRTARPSRLRGRAPDERASPVDVAPATGSELTCTSTQLIEALRAPRPGWRPRGSGAGGWPRRCWRASGCWSPGNGGSAAEAQHLTAELVGRYDGDRPPLSAIALHAETSSLTAIGNDYGAAEAYARQVAAHGRAGDIVLLLSASGRSPNVLRAAERARTLGLTVWAMTGPAPNPLAPLADDAICVAGADTGDRPGGPLVAIHALCGALDAGISAVTAR